MTNQERLQANNAKIEAIQDALKNKVGTSGEIEIVENGKYDVSKYASANVNVQSNLQEKTVTENGEVVADSGYDGLSKVNVEVPSVFGRNYGKYLIQVFDYDGTILKEEKLNTGDIFTLPNIPTHEKLVFESWASSQEIIDNGVIIDNNNVSICASYTTKSGLSEFDIELNSSTGLDVTVNSTAIKNWGDGTEDTSTTHTYTSYGSYTIKVDTKYFAQQSQMKPFITPNEVLKSMRLVNNVEFNGYCFYATNLNTVSFSTNKSSGTAQIFRDCDRLVFSQLPQGATELVFTECYSLKNAVIPLGVTSLPSQSFSNCYSLQNISIPKTVTSIGIYCFNKCYSIRNIIIPSSVNIIEANAFINCSGIIEYDFTQHTSIPTLANTNAFSGINKLCKIIVPDELYDSWIVATNWTTYAGIIYKASEVEL